MNILKTSISNIGDPFILVENGTYYHYSTSDKFGFKVYKSMDLISWKNMGYCYKDSKVGYMDFWAPEVYKKNNEFYMFFSSKNKKTNKLMISVAVSKSPLGPFIDVYDYPTFDFGYSAIDPTLYEENGNYYMFYVRDCSDNVINGVHTSQIYAVKLKSNLTELDGEPVLILTPEGEFEQRDSKWQWNEGPSILKHDKKYYLSYSTNCFSDKLYSVCYAVSDKLLGKYEKSKENPILTYIEGIISGPGHNSYFKTTDGELMTAYHIHTDINNPSGDRTTCFSKYYFNENNDLIIDYKKKEEEQI